jgi:TPR repeat protein
VHAFHCLRFLYSKNASDAGNPEALTLGLMHGHGQGGPQDFLETQRLIGLAATQGRLIGLAATQGHADAQYRLADVLYAGLGGPKDKAGARRLYGLAAAQGLAEAQFNLGLMHCQGQGGPQDFPEARRLYGLAAAQGDPDAQRSLGLMH